MYRPTEQRSEYRPTDQYSEWQRPMSRARSSCRSGMSGLMSVLSGAGLGALVMYLFDPQNGPVRRESLGESAGTALGAAGEKAGDAWEYTRPAARAVGEGATTAGVGLASLGAGLGRRAVRLGRSIADRVSEGGAALGHGAVSLWEHAADTGRRAGKVVGESTRQAGGAVGRSAMHAGRYARGAQQQKDDFPVAGVSAGVAGALLVGAGLMYFFDPARGRSRRARFADQGAATLRRTGRYFRGKGVDLGNRMRGVYHESRKAMPEMSDVRQGIGRAMESATGGVMSGRDDSGREPQSDPRGPLSQPQGGAVTGTTPIPPSTSPVI